MSELIADYPEIEWNEKRKKAIRAGALALAAAVAISGVSHSFMPNLAREREPEHIEYAIEADSAKAPENLVHPPISGEPGVTPESSVAGSSLKLSDGSRVTLSTLRN
jgi:hypothetical protein